MLRIPSARVFLTAAILLALSASAGCSWFRGKSDYESSQESRPLEAPPGLDLPRADPAMQVPAATAAAAANAAAATGATPPAAAGAAAAGTGAAAGVTEFTITDTPDSAWSRLGLALGRIDGVTVGKRAQLLGTYEVEYKGAKFLLRAQVQGEGTTVNAIDAGGAPLTSGPAAELLALLKARLG